MEELLLSENWKIKELERLERIKESKPKDFENILKTKEDNRLQLMARKNVIGLGIGLRTRGGKLTDELVLKVFVSQKVPRKLLSEDDLIPSSFEKEGSIVKVDVEVGKIPIIQTFTLRTRPLIGGVSIGPTPGGTGTLGVCVTLDNQRTYVLSNNHVLANTDQLPIGTRIVQPSISDGGDAANDIVAELHSVVPIDFGTSTIYWPGVGPITFPNPNHVDCALGTILGKFPFNEANREIHWVGYPAYGTRKVEEPTSAVDFLRMWLSPVHKMGRTTEYTVGHVSDPVYDTYVDYSPAFGNPLGTNIAYFVDQLRINPSSNFTRFSNFGDSGSLVLDANTNEPIGLLFAGDPTAGYAVCNHIDRVMNGLNISRI